MSETRRVGGGTWDSALCERPNTNPEDTGIRQDHASSSERRSGKQKVHSLIDKVFSRTNLGRAWEKVKKNRGSAGLDDLTIAQVEERQEYYRDLLHRQLRDGTYQPQPVKRVEIETADGGVRTLGIPTVLERVVQQALVQRMEPIFEPQFLDCSFGYRKGRSPHAAMRKVWQELSSGADWLVDADLRAFFDTIAQEQLIDLIAEEISDGRVLPLVRDMLRAGVWEEGRWAPTETGVPQGGVASPLWSNIFLTPVDRWMTAQGFRLTRWADDFVVVCRTKAEAQRALASAERFLREALGVALHPQQTRIVHVQQGFEFLGYKITRGKGFRLPAHQRRSKANPHDLDAIPRPKSLTRFQERSRSLTRRKAPITLPELIERINPVIRGWGTYYRKAHVRGLFNRLDRWIERRLYSFLAKRWRNTMWRKYPKLIEEYGLVRRTHLLPGLVQG
jgi:RNA-directed DNA polymerase